MEIKRVRKTSVGGQALMEGVMMLGPKGMATAVRNPEGEIITECQEITRMKDKHKVFSWPVIRGVVNYIDSMVLGYKALMRSAEIAFPDDEEEEEETEKEKKRREKKENKKKNKGNSVEVSESEKVVEEAAAADEPVEESMAEVESETKTAKSEGEEVTEEKTDGNKAENTDSEKKEKSKSTDTLIAVVTGIASVLGVVLAVLLFFYLPVLVFNRLNAWTGGAITNFQGLIEGVLKIIIFIAYMALVSLMKDMKRMFMYHGAEHKTIACYEAGMELTVENVKKCTRFHPRCGTSFIFVILIVGIIFYTIIAKIFPTIASMTVLWMLLRLVFLPVIVGVCYEFIQYAGKHDNLFVKILSAPGLWMQRLSTKEPTDDIIEVGIASLKAVITDNPEDDTIK